MNITLTVKTKDLYSNIKLAFILFRCLVNEFGSSAIPKPGSEEFENIVVKDMAINIYRDGKVGRYGHILINQGESIFN